MNSYLLQLKHQIIRLLKDEPVQIILFGSRARHQETIASDVDIGIIPKGIFDRAKITLLREWIEFSNIPYKVEIVDFEQVSETFKREALRNADFWKV